MGKKSKAKTPAKNVDAPLDAQKTRETEDDTPARGRGRVTDFSPDHVEFLHAYEHDFLEGNNKARGQLYKRARVEMQEHFGVDHDYKICLSAGIPTVIDIEALDPDARTVLEAKREEGKGKLQRKIGEYLRTKYRNKETAEPNETDVFWARVTELVAGKPRNEGAYALFCEEEADHLNTTFQKNWTAQLENGVLEGDRVGRQQQWKNAAWKALNAEARDAYGARAEKRHQLALEKYQKMLERPSFTPEAYVDNRVMVKKILPSIMDAIDQLTGYSSILLCVGPNEKGNMDLFSTHSSNAGRMTDKIWPDHNEAAFATVQDLLYNFGSDLFSAQVCRDRIVRKDLSSGDQLKMRLEDLDIPTPVKRAKATVAEDSPAPSANPMSSIVLASSDVKSDGRDHITSQRVCLPKPDGSQAFVFQAPSSELLPDSNIDPPRTESSSQFLSSLLSNESNYATQDPDQDPDTSSSMFWASLAPYMTITNIGMDLSAEGGGMETAGHSTMQVFNQDFDVDAFFNLASGIPVAQTEPVHFAAATLPPADPSLMSTAELPCGSALAVGAAIPPDLPAQPLNDFPSGNPAISAARDFFPPTGPTAPQPTFHAPLGSSPPHFTRKGRPPGRLVFPFHAPPIAQPPASPIPFNNSVDPNRNATSGDGIFVGDGLKDPGADTVETAKKFKGPISRKRTIEEVELASETLRPRKRAAPQQVSLGYLEKKKKKKGVVEKKQAGKKNTKAAQK